MKELNMNDIEIKRHAQTPNVRKKKPMSFRAAGKARNDIIFCAAANRPHLLR